MDRGEKPLFGDRMQSPPSRARSSLRTSPPEAMPVHARGEPVEPRAGSAAGRATYETSSDRAAARALADQGVLLAAAEKAPASPEYGQGWTDDMFMATAVLAASGGRAGHEHDLDLAARLLIQYAARLQQASGLFNHATDGPAAWGRGNGFAALGFMETLTRCRRRTRRARRCWTIYRRQMAAVLAQQAPDGMWRQVIDAPGAYREESATAMLMTAMARGMRLGWLDRSYLPAIRTRRGVGCPRTSPMRARSSTCAPAQVRGPTGATSSIVRR